jgi:hypothetical protein
MKFIFCARQRWMGTALSLVVLYSSAFLSGQTPKPVTVDALAWMAGAWVGRAGGVETEEHWLPPKGGNMLGLNRSIRAGRPAGFEFLRIAATTNGVSYFASPQGRPPTEFPLKEAGERSVIFENSKHDFPQRIIYRLEDGRVLHARIEGTLNGSPRSQEWRWEKAAATP